MATDYELLDRWQGGESAAGEELFGRHFDGIYRFLAGKVADDAGDLAQKVFMAVVEGHEGFRREASFRTLLFAIARNVLYRHWRDKKKNAGLDFGVTSLHDLSPTPSVAAAAHERDQLLTDALRQLPVEMQLCVELHYWHGLSGPEVARVLEIPEGTVRSRLRRALTDLKQRVSVLASQPGHAPHADRTLSDVQAWERSLD